jgi:hypothetical protein
MEVHVTVTPNAREAAVLRIDDLNYKVKVNAKAVDGKANERLVAVMAEYFKVPKSRVRITRGFASRKKTIEIRQG